jgi:hypothetical protein
MGIALLSFTFLIVVKQWDNPINELPNVIPTTITIEDDKIERSGLQSYRLVNIQDIKEIWDMGSFYAIIFYFPNSDIFSKHWSGSCLLFTELLYCTPDYTKPSLNFLTVYK